ncbi:heat-inducible transcriptional repressor HrcA [Rhodocaloribacter litoris]|uniref:heat-inducible transcriptional repressor HrcA n=1 Tax=Rhodocaloribacter litoris TaxID=2558931 RepID=UPI001E530ED5|nr:heat-inducible transcriptional repressor HrcA [Rhodocaloribacter litoris]
MHTTHRTYGETPYSLNQREREILRLVVQSFVHTAGPVGSRFLSKRYPLGLSPASIRNTMSDLEERGYLDHPYTSAGRIPTELGYRAYVDELMETVPVPPSVRRSLKHRLRPARQDAEEMLRIGSRLLGELTNLLGVVLSPRLSTGVLERLEIVPLSSTRVMFVLSVRGGLIRTMIFPMQAGHDIRREELVRIVALLNERLAGLTLEEIRRSCRPRVRDLEDTTGLVRLILDESTTLFSELTDTRHVEYGGTGNILALPEFKEPADLRGLIEMLEDETTLVYLLEEPDPPAEFDVARAQVRIGSENRRAAVGGEKVERFSVVTARYKLGDTVGTIGVIGPTRMDYARVVALVEEMARQMSGPAEVS